MWVTLSADFLAYPGWLAAQKADFILGPVLAGLYWCRRRPQSRFGPMLIGFGFIGALYILQSAGNSWLFSIGLLAETALGLATRVLILAFPTGRLDRPAMVILVISIFASPLPAVLNQLLSPQTGAGASISGCRAACPRNEFAITSNPEFAADLLDVFRFGVILASGLTARATKRLVGQSVRGPSRDELEAMLRGPLGDPDLRLVFLGDSEGPPPAEPGRHVTLVRHEGAPAVAIIHDPQLNDDPELLEAAGAIALLAAENAELDAGWAEALRELERSRARLVRAADDERRKFERNLHDSVQQQLISIKLRLEMEAEDGALSESSRERLLALTQSLDTALAQVREVAHGLYPPHLAASGLPAALRHIQQHATPPTRVDAVGVGRYAPEIESAVYYCCLEAIQNARKHGGRGVLVSVALVEEDGRLTFHVVDDGPGFSLGEVRGSGLQNMEDRLGALGGRLTIATVLGRGTTISGQVPLRPATPEP